MGATRPHGGGQSHRQCRWSRRAGRWPRHRHVRLLVGWHERHQWGAVVLGQDDRRDGWVLLPATIRPGVGGHLVRTRGSRRVVMAHPRRAVDPIHGGVMDGGGHMVALSRHHVRALVRKRDIPGGSSHRGCAPWASRGRLPGNARQVQRCDGGAVPLAATTRYAPRAGRRRRHRCRDRGSSALSWLLGSGASTSESSGRRAVYRSRARRSSTSCRLRHPTTSFGS